MTDPMKKPFCDWRRAVASVLALAMLSSSCIGSYAQTAARGGEGVGDGPSTTAGPIRLRQPNGNESYQYDDNSDRDGRNSAQRPTREQAVVSRYRPGEFELFVRQLAGQAPQPSNGDGAQQSADDGTIRRFGAELVTDIRPDATDYAPQVPPDYLLVPGDEVAVTIWGSVDADLRLKIDRSGRLNLPRVGPVLVAGVRYGDLPALLTQRVSQVFKNFQLSASLGQLRSIRIYVTGFTPRPGSYAVSSLSTIVNALMRTGGPSAAGSFRNIELHRAGKLITTFDLYDLLLKGDKSADRTLQAEDVVHIGPVGPQAAVIGSVNKPAIFELKQGESIADLLRMAGGYTAVADRNRLTVERLEDRSNIRIAQLAMPKDARQFPSNGDVIRAISAVVATLSHQQQNKRVRVDGEVANPGDFILPPGSTTADALRAAGGFTPSAYVFGTEFNRESVRKTQEQNYERALRDLETEFTRATSTQKSLTADEAQTKTSQAAAATRLIDRLRQVHPTGRVVFQLNPADRQLPNLPIEDGDRLFVPAVPSAVGVFGSIFNGGSYLYSDGNRVSDYIHLAGGPTRGADTGSVFVVRANGSVVSARQRAGLFGSGANLSGVTAQPGDTVFVPEELDKTTFSQFAQQWTQILYQFALGAAAFKVIKD